jgi:hypothetical protein
MYGAAVYVDRRALRVQDSLREHFGPVGPSRLIAPPKFSVANRGIAEIGRPPSIAEGDADDANRTLRDLAHASACAARSAGFVRACTAAMAFCPRGGQD